MRRAEDHFGLTALDQRDAMIGNTREITPLGGSHQLAHFAVGQLAGTPHIDVESAQRRRDLDVERLGEATQIGGDVARDIGGVVELRGEQRAGLDVDDVMRSRAHEADFLAGVGEEMRVKRRATTARAMGSTRRCEMKLTSQTMACGGSGSDGAVSVRASVPSRESTRGSAASRGSNWPWPTSTETT